MYRNELILSFFTGFADSLWKISLIIAGFLLFLVIIYFLVKSDIFRKFCGYFLCVVIVFGGIVSGVNLNKYYNTSGGIIGKLSQVLNPNLVVVEDTRDDIVFDFKSIMLTEYGEDKYRATFTTSDYIELAPNEAYAVFVNNAPCELIEYGEDYTSNEISSDYVIAEFVYAFYDENLDFILKDTLTFRFAFYKNSTYLIVETSGGSDAVNLWNSYFQKNDFIVSIKAMESVYMSSYSSVKLMNGDGIISEIKVKNGSTYVLPETISINGYRFMGYSLDGTNLTSETNFVISDDVVIYVMFEKVDYIRYCELYSGYKDINDNIIEIVDYLEGETLSLYAPENPTRNNYTFLGWSLDGETVVDLSTIVNDGTISNIYAVWEVSAIDINFVVNGGSVIIGDVSYTDDFVISYDFDETIVLSEPIKDNFKFHCYSIELIDDSSTYYTISDSNLNMSLSDIVDDINAEFNIRDDEDFEALRVKELTSVTITIQYIANTPTPSILTDEELIYYICNQSDTFGSGWSSYPTTCEDVIIKTYCRFAGISYDSCDKTLYEILVFFNDALDYDIEITEQTTAREFLEVDYLATWNAEG